MINGTTTSTNIPIHITAHHVHLSDFITKFLADKIGAIARLSRDVLAIDVVLRRTTDPANGRFGASVRLALPGRDIHSRAVAQDLYVAIGLVGAKLARRMRKRKTRFSKTYRARAEARRIGGRNAASAQMRPLTDSHPLEEGMKRIAMHEEAHL